MKTHLRILLIYILSMFCVKAEPVILVFETSKDRIMVEYDNVDAIRWIWFKTSKPLGRNKIKHQLLPILSDLETKRMKLSQATALNQLLKRLSLKHKASKIKNLESNVFIIKKGVFSYYAVNDQLINQFKAFLTSEIEGKEFDGNKKE